MREVTSSEIRVLINEMKHLEGSFLRKFYDLGDGAFRLGFYKEGKNTQVYCKLLLTINETRFAESAEQATPFAIAVRKRIEDQKVTGIRQHKFDRIIVFDISSKDEEYQLLFEMFGRGNVLLLDKSGKIELCYKIMSFKDREIKPKVPYVLPESRSMAIDSLDGKEIEEQLEKIEADGSKLMSELSKSVNIGPIYLEDLIKKSGLDPRGKVTNAAQIQSLKQHILAFAKVVEKPAPRIYKKDGIAVDYAITDIAKYDGFEKLEFGRLCETLDQMHEEARFVQKDVERNKHIDEINANIKKQMELAEQLKKDSVDYAAMGHKILANMNAVNAVIFYLRERKRATLDELKNVFGDLKVKELDLKDKIVKIEID